MDRRIWGCGIARGNNWVVEVEGDPKGRLRENQVVPKDVNLEIATDKFL